MAPACTPVTPIFSISSVNTPGSLSTVDQLGPLSITENESASYVAVAAIYTENPSAGCYFLLAKAVQPLLDDDGEAHIGHVDSDARVSSSSSDGAVIEGYKYAKSHEWAKVDGGVATVGISDHAQAELGDVVYVELPDVGKEVKQGETFGVVESVKACHRMNRNHTHRIAAFLNLAFAAHRLQAMYTPPSLVKLWRSTLCWPTSQPLAMISAQAEQQEPQLCATLTVNADPYTSGWIIKVKLSDTSNLSNLMDSAAYQAVCDEAH
ncbi:hypothetical protein QJQ45_015114 [Haematococcus lacustris]|nr:hypothetical protein QJQ45_015114 [Haematococcus lacustris]